MSPKHFDNLSLIFHADHMEMIFHDTAHFDEALFLNCMAMKLEHYGDQAVGTWITREDPYAQHSIDPIFLVDHKTLIEAHISWIVIVSNNHSDYQNMQYIVQLTEVPCQFVNTREAAQQWIYNL